MSVTNQNKKKHLGLIVKIESYWVIIIVMWNIKSFTNYIKTFTLAHAWIHHCTMYL